jgi:cadmium resistance protein CadD (predicted permease)
VNPWETVATATGAFAITNVDDLLVITTLFTTAHTPTGPRPAAIIAGQYLGFAALVASSILGAVGVLAVPDPWVGLLGLIPLGLGLRALWRSSNRQHPDHAAANVVPVRGVVGVAAVTFANGADNIAVYIPLFRRAGPAQAALTIAVFAALLAVWCLAGAGLGRHPVVLHVIERAGHLLIPVVFIVVGLAILIEAGTLSALLPG